MSKLKFSFLVLMLMVSVSASADWAPADVQAALKKMYPTADGVAWSHDESYYVADFLMNGFDTKVWFDGQAQWVMQQTDWETMDEVPPAVYNAFAASEYSGGMVQNVTWVQFPKWQSIVAVEVGMANLQTKYQILFTPTGEIIRARRSHFLVTSVRIPAEFIISLPSQTRLLWTKTLFSRRFIM